MVIDNDREEEIIRGWKKLREMDFSLISLEIKGKKPVPHSNSNVSRYKQNILNEIREKCRRKATTNTCILYIKFSRIRDEKELPDVDNLLKPFLDAINLDVDAIVKRHSQEESHINKDKLRGVIRTIKNKLVKQSNENIANDFQSIIKNITVKNQNILSSSLIERLSDATEKALVVDDRQIGCIRAQIVYVDSECEEGISFTLVPTYTLQISSVEEIKEKDDLFRLNEARERYMEETRAKEEYEALLKKNKKKLIKDWGRKHYKGILVQTEKYMKEYLTDEEYEERRKNGRDPKYRTTSIWQKPMQMIVAEIKGNKGKFILFDSLPNQLWSVGGQYTDTSEEQQLLHKPEPGFDWKKGQATDGTIEGVMIFTRSGCWWANKWEE